MKELFLACLGIVLLSALFFCMGSLFMQKLNMKTDALFAYVIGYLLYFAVLEILVVPMTIKWVSLTTASFVWLAVMAFFALVSVFCCRRIWREQISCMIGEIRKHSFMFPIVVIVILLQCLMVVLYQDTTVDAAYFVGTVSTSVYTDTLGRYDPYTGELLKYFKIRYVFSSYPMNNAIWSRLTGIHPIVQSKVVMSVINVFTANLVIYQIGKKLFSGNRKKADLMVVFVCVLQLFCGTIYTTGTFFFTRIYEGKAILGNIALPMVLLCAVWYIQNKESRTVWYVLFITALSALAFSGSSIILPVAIIAGMGSVSVLQKKWSGLIYSLICIAPIGIYLVIYEAGAKGLITFFAS